MSTFINFIIRQIYYGDKIMEYLFSKVCKIWGKNKEIENFSLKTLERKS
jgi:hypothetical protein